MKKNKNIKKVKTKKPTLEQEHVKTLIHFTEKYTKNVNGDPDSLFVGQLERLNTRLKKLG